MPSEQNQQASWITLEVVPSTDPAEFELVVRFQPGEHPGCHSCADELLTIICAAAKEYAAQLAQNQGEKNHVTH